MSRFGNMLRDRREVAGLTQEDLAARLGVSRATISRWELGTDLPASGNVDDIARFVRMPGRDLQWVLDGRRPAPEQDMIETRIADLEQRLGEVVSILNGLFDRVSFDSQRVSLAVGGRTICIDGSTGEIGFEDQNGNEIRLDSAGIHVSTGTTIFMAASTIDTAAASIDSQAGITKLHGAVKCDTLMAASVIANTYSSGAGNIWLRGPAFLALTQEGDERTTLAIGAQEWQRCIHACERLFAPFDVAPRAASRGSRRGRGASNRLCCRNVRSGRSCPARPEMPWPSRSSGCPNESIGFRTASARLRPNMNGRRSATGCRMMRPASTIAPGHASGEAGDPRRRSRRPAVFSLRAQRPKSTKRGICAFVVWRLIRSHD
jgi:transcriptional regulator with XRE-family HTH domain